MLKKFAIIGSALAFATVIATPASAHGAPVQHTPTHATPGRASALSQQITQLERDVDRAEARKTVSHKEAAGLRRDIAGLKQQHRRANANGISPSEARSLENGIAKVRHRLHDERRDDDRHTH